MNVCQQRLVLRHHQLSVLCADLMQLHSHVKHTKPASCESISLFRRLTLVLNKIFSLSDVLKALSSSPRGPRSRPIIGKTPSELPTGNPSAMCHQLRTPGHAKEAAADPEFPEQGLGQWIATDPAHTHRIPRPVLTPRQGSGQAPPGGRPCLAVAAGRWGGVLRRPSGGFPPLPPPAASSSPRFSVVLPCVPAMPWCWSTCRWPMPLPQ